MKGQSVNNEGSFVTGRSCEMKIILTLKCSLNLFWRWRSFFTCSTDFVVHTSWQVLITKPRAISVNEGWSRCLAYGPCRRCAYCAGRGQLPGLSLGFHGASVSRFYDHACLVFLTNIFSCTTERFPCNGDVAIDLCPPLAIHIPSSTRSTSKQHCGALQGNSCDYFDYSHLKPIPRWMISIFFFLLRTDFVIRSRVEDPVDKRAKMGGVKWVS